MVEARQIRTCADARSHRRHLGQAAPIKSYVRTRGVIRLRGRRAAAKAGGAEGAFLRRFRPDERELRRTRGSIVRIGTGAI
jgi:hypothetical protein